MPRKSRPVTIDNTPINERLVREDAAKVDRHNQALARIDEKFADGTPYDRGRCIAEARFYMGQSAEAMFEMGKRLVLLKEHEPHGDFLQALDSIGIAARTAQLMMNATVKLASNAKSISHLGRTKLLDLAYLDDEQLADLGEGGTVAGLSLDAIERMSTRELREALRREKAERERDKQVHERVLKTKNDKIDDYERKIARRDSSAPAARFEALREEVWQAVSDVGVPLLRIEQIFQDIAAVEQSREILPEALHMTRGQVLAFLVQALLDMRDRHGIDVDLEERITPPWMQQEKG